MQYLLLHFHSCRREVPTNTHKPKPVILIIEEVNNLMKWMKALLVISALLLPSSSYFILHFIHNIWHVPPNSSNCLPGQSRMVWGISLSFSKLFSIRYLLEVIYFAINCSCIWCCLRFMFVVWYSPCVLWCHPFVCCIRFANFSCKFSANSCNLNKFLLRFTIYDLLLRIQIYFECTSRWKWNPLKCASFNLRFKLLLTFCGFCFHFYRCIFIEGFRAISSNCKILFHYLKTLIEQQVYLQHQYSGSFQFNIELSCIG